MTTKKNTVNSFEQIGTLFEQGHEFKSDGSKFNRHKPKEIKTKYVNDKEKYEERIKQKEVMEEDIFERLNQMLPWKIEKTNKEEDKRGIDGKNRGLKDAKEEKEATTFQIKKRQEKSDIAVEICNPWNDNHLDKQFIEILSGRDMKYDVDEYYCINNSGYLRIVDAKYLKEIAKKIASIFFENKKENKKLTRFKTEYGIAMLVNDKDFKNRPIKKLLVFIYPKKIKTKYKVQM